MEEYRRIRERRAKAASATGVLLTVVFHLALGFFAVYNGLGYIYPPPQERVFVIDFGEAPAEVGMAGEDTGSAPEVPAQEQKAEALTENGSDDFGDVESAQPKSEEIDLRSLFPSVSGKADKDTLAAHSAGARQTGKAGKGPNAQVAGRSTVGDIPKPVYTGQETGTVVVKVWVDKWGEVKKAQAGDDGTTVNDATLWAAARKAAMETHFSISADAPALQEGTITYIFNLK